MNHIKPIVLAVMFACASLPVAAQEKESLELLRNTTMNLIDALVEAGVLTREKADTLVKEAERNAARTAAARAKAAPASQSVRVPYVPETVKNEIRDQVKQEVLAQARNERWAEPNAIPSWLDRIQFFGDMRVRYQFDNFDKTNTAPIDYFTIDKTSTLTTRDPDLADRGNVDGNTQTDISRLRLRARFGLNARLSDSVSGTIRLATGSTGDPVSTNQTLGSGFNKYSILLDRAAIRYLPIPWLTVEGGRMANPWQSSEIMWDEDLSFDGLALTLKRPEERNFTPFMTLGVMPLSAKRPQVDPRSRTLLGAQVGAEWVMNSSWRVRSAAAYYNFRNLEGVREPDSSFQGGVAIDPAYGSSALPSEFRQRGNTYFRTNASNDGLTATKWGLASQFRPLHIGFGLDYARYDPMHWVLTADYINNLAFSRTEIRNRTGVDLADGSGVGYQMRILFGVPDIRRRGEWNTSLAYRRVGSDAVPDGFTDSDLGLGGTNLRGFVLGGSYGLEDNTALGLRFLSAKNIDALTQAGNPAQKYSVDSVQLDMNVRF